MCGRVQKKTGKCGWEFGAVSFRDDMQVAIAVG